VGHGLIAVIIGHMHMALGHRICVEAIMDDRRDTVLRASPRNSRRASLSYRPVPRVCAGGNALSVALPQVSGSVLRKRGREEDYDSPGGIHIFQI
jgi:hypothetical protein